MISCLYFALQVLDYILVTGEFAFTDIPKSQKDISPLQSVFCALCNVNLTLMSKDLEVGVAEQLEPDKDEVSELLDCEKMSLIHALYCYCIGNTWINANSKVIYKVKISTLSSTCIIVYM